MKKLVIVFVVCANLALIGCTEDSLTEELHQEVRADGGGDGGEIDPPEPPPED